MNVLLINPPIYDFAAHDFWLKPYGLVHIAGILRKAGVSNLHFFDFMDRSHFPHIKPDRYGRGKFPGIEVKKPDVLEFVPRKYKRYGAPQERFVEFLKGIDEPEFVLISTGMTYWYPGVKEVVEITREMFPRAKIVLGGTYSSIIPEHAKEVINPEHIFTDTARLFEFMGVNKPPLNAHPDWGFYHYLPYGVIKLTEGCPFRCTYCAVWILHPHFRIRNLSEVAEEIQYFRDRGIRDIVFYDDALLVNPQRGILPLLEMVKDWGLRFHTPNALHAKFITSEVARAMYDAGFESIYIGYETTDPERQRATGGKVTSENFYNAVENLLSAGFSRDQITVYLLMGLPGQPPEEVEQGMREVSELGLKIMLSEYSPIPGTPDGEKAKAYADVDEPLLQNNIVFPIIYYGYETVRRLKSLKNLLNRQ